MVGWFSSGPLKIKNVRLAERIKKAPRLHFSKKAKLCMKCHNIRILVPVIVWTNFGLNLVILRLRLFSALSK